MIINSPLLTGLLSEGLVLNVKKKLKKNSTLHYSTEPLYQSPATELKASLLNKWQLSIIYISVF